MNPSKLKVIPKPVITEDAPEREKIEEIITDISKHNIDVLELTQVRVKAKVTSALLEILQLNRRIKSLTLKDCNLDSSSIPKIAQYLERNIYLEHLDISLNNFSTTPIEPLANALALNQHLYSLNLSGTRIEDYGVRAISKALEINKSVSELYIRNVNCSNYGAVALSQAIQSHHAFTIIDLSYNIIGISGVKTIVAAVAALHTFSILNLDNNLENINGSTDAIKFAASILRHNPYIMGLSMRGLYLDKIPFTELQNFISQPTHLYFSLMNTLNITQEQTDDFEEQYEGAELLFHRMHISNKMNSFENIAHKNASLIEKLLNTFVSSHKDSTITRAHYKLHEILSLYKSLQSRDCKLENNELIASISNIDKYVNHYICVGLSKIFGAVLGRAERELKPNIKLEDYGYPFDIISHILTNLTIQQRCFLSIKFNTEENILKAREKQIPKTTNDSQCITM